MASNLTVDTLTKGATTLITDELVDVNNTRVCKAWVNFNGQGTVAIRDSYNVSSITDNGTGQYQVNFTTAMTNADYSCAGSGNDNQALVTTYGGTYSTTTARVYVVASASGSTYDFSRVCMMYFSS